MQETSRGKITSGEVEYLAVVALIAGQVVHDGRHGFGSYLVLVLHPAVANSDRSESMVAD